MSKTANVPSVSVGNPAGREIWGGQYADVEHFGEGRAWLAGGHRRTDRAGGVGRGPRAAQWRDDAQRADPDPGLRWPERMILNSAVPIRGAGTKIQGAIVLNQDVTERRAAEEALRRSEEQLRQAQKMEAVGQLAGGIAHDFNNLLTGILSYCDLMLEEVRQGDPIRSDVEQIRHAGQRAAGLTRQLLAFSRRQVLQPRVLSLNSTVTELDGMLRRLIGADIGLETRARPRALVRARRPRPDRAGAGQPGGERRATRCPRAAGSRSRPRTASIPPRDSSGRTVCGPARTSC